MVAGVAAYFSGERKLYFSHSEPIASEWRLPIEPYFSAALLDKVRTVTLVGARIPPPPFYAEALRMTGGQFPDFVHMASVTYVDVIVFNERIESRPLFHGVVHAAQIEIVGFEQYLRKRREIFFRWKKRFGSGSSRANTVSRVGRARLARTDL